MLSEEKDAIRALAKGGMCTGVIATALFISKRQVKFVLGHPDDDTEAVRRGDI
jgi:orotate phosphoribosyltransferase-like protein